MTIIVPTKPFREALSRLQPLTTAKASLPQLGAVTISMDFSGVILSGSNLDQWMSVRTEGDADQECEDFSVSSIDLYNTLRFISEEETALKVQDQVCTVSAGSSTAKLPLITDPMPLMPSPEWGQPFLIEKLPELVNECLPFMCTNPSKYMLCGVYFSSYYGLIACSGTGLIKIAREISGQANVPSAAAQLISKESGDATCRFSSGLAEFKGEDWTITTKLIEGSDGSKYPNCEPLLKCDIKHTLKVDRVAAIKAAAFAALPLPVHLDTVGAEHTATTLRFFSPKSCPNPRDRTIPAEATKDWSWAVSARKLATALNAFDGESVELGFTDASSVIIEQGDTFVVQYLCRLGA